MEPSPSSDARDPEDPEDEEGWGPVERLLHECLSAPREEGGERLEEACRRHPEHATELRARVRLLEETGLAEVRREFPERLGEFRLVRRLGGGGMGVVYLAEQGSLGRRVALKLIDSRRLYFPGSRERFLREAGAVARLSHPGIAHLYTCGEEKGIPYFAMELVEGCTLAEVLLRLAGAAPEQLSGRDLVRVLPPCGAERAAEGLFGGSWVDVCFRLAGRVAEALDHAHAHGVVHRDVKPSNIMVTPTGRVLLVDFGLATDRETQRLTMTGSHVGSLPYMAPEQFGGGPADHRVDIYALGITLYELLTLASPYLADSTEETRRRIEEARPRPIRSLNRAVAWDAETVCRHAMDPDRARRYPDAAAFARDLRNVVALRPIEARRPGRWLRVRRWSRRHPLRAAALALLALGLPALGVGSAHFVPQVVAGRERLHQARIEETLEEGFSALLLGNSEDAIPLFRRTLELDPAQVEAVGGLFLAARDGRGPEQEVATMLRSLEVHRRGGCDERTLDRLRVMLLRKEGRNGEARELLLRLGEPQTPFELFMEAVVAMRADPTGAPRSFRIPLAHLDKAVARLPSARFHYHAVRALAAMGAMDRAVSRACADTIEALWPDLPRAWLWICYARRHAEPALAVPAGRRFVALFPDVELGQESLGIALENCGDVDGAIATLRDNLARHRGSGAAHMNLANALLAKGEIGEAGSLGAQAVRLAPDSLSLRLQYGNVLVQAGNIAGATDEIREAARIDPQHAETHSNLCGLLHLLGENEEAREAALRAIRIDPRLAAAHVNLAVALRALGDLRGAARAARVAVDLEPGWDRAHENLVTTLEEARDLTGLRAELERWGRVKPDNAAAAAALAWFLLNPRNGRTDAHLALALAQRAQRLSQHGDPEVLRALAEAQFATGDPLSAIATAESALRAAPTDEVRAFLARRLKKYRGQTSRPAEGG